MHSPFVHTQFLSSGVERRGWELVDAGVCLCMVRVGVPEPGVCQLYHRLSPPADQPRTTFSTPSGHPSDLLQ
jgi:hypothetical protein